MVISPLIQCDRLEFIIITNKLWSSGGYIWTHSVWSIKFIKLRALSRKLERKAESLEPKTGVKSWEPWAENWSQKLRALRRKLEPKAESLEAKTGAEIGRFSCNVSHVFRPCRPVFLELLPIFAIWAGIYGQEISPTLFLPLSIILMDSKLVHHFLVL
jgi:hypothetical protein